MGLRRNCKAENLLRKTMRTYMLPFAEVAKKYDKMLKEVMKELESILLSLRSDAGPGGVQSLKQLQDLAGRARDLHKSALEGLFWSFIPLETEYDQKSAALAELQKIIAGIPATILATHQVEAFSKSSSKPFELAKPQSLGKFNHELEGTRIAEFLAYRGLVLVETVKDGDCMYDAIQHQLLLEGTDTTISALRTA